jgi:hypothetical protein
MRESSHAGRDSNIGEIPKVVPWTGDAIDAAAADTSYVGRHQFMSANGGVTMRKRLLAVIVLAVSIAVGASSASALVKPRVFTLLEVDGLQQPLGDFADSSRPPVGGDQFVQTNTLYRWTGTKGARVGRTRELFTFMTGFGPNFSHRAVVLVQAQMYLPDGTIFVQGYISILPGDSPQTFEVPVVGGTRIYANARGYVRARVARRTLTEFHLTP